MVGIKTGRTLLISVVMIGLAGCAGGYGRMAYNSDYDRYYGNSSGYNSVPYGYAGSNFGWSQGYYYPGTGNMVYNRQGVSRNWTYSQRRHWEKRAARPNQHRGHHNGRGPNG